MPTIEAINPTRESWLEARASLPIHLARVASHFSKTPSPDLDDLLDRSTFKEDINANFQALIDYLAQSTLKAHLDLSGRYDDIEASGLQSLMRAASLITDQIEKIKPQIDILNQGSKNDSAGQKILLMKTHRKALSKACSEIALMTAGFLELQDKVLKPYFDDLQAQTELEEKKGAAPSKRGPKGP